MVDGDGGTRFGGDCWLCVFDGGRERWEGRERIDLFILLVGIVYIILINYVKIKTRMLGEL